MSLVGTGIAYAQESAADGDDVRAALESAAVLLRMGQVDDVLAALARVERVEPDNPWLWYYRGAAHVQRGAPYEALAALDRAADLLAELGQPDAELASAVAQQRVLARRQVFGVGLRLGLAYDTNVTYLGGGASTLGLIAGRGDGEFNSQARVDFAPLATPEHTFALGGRVAHAWHFAIEQFDWQEYSGYLRYARRLGGGFEAELRYDYTVSVLGNESFLSQHVFTPRLTYRWPVKPSRVQLDDTSVYYRFEARDFLFDTTPALDQDGTVHAVGVEQRLHIQPLADVNWTCDVGLGYQFGSVFTEGDEFDRRTHDFFLSLDMPLRDPADLDHYLFIPDKELRFRFDAWWQRADYRHGSTFDRNRDAREDLITTLGFTLSQKLVEDPRLGDLTLHALISWTDAASSVTTRNRVSPFTYERTVYGLQLEWSW